MNRIVRTGRKQIKPALPLAGALLTWPLGTALWLANIAGVGITRDQPCGVVVIWLLLLGALGCPALALRPIARRLNVRGLQILATGALAVMGLLTILITVGSVTTDILNTCLALGVPGTVCVCTLAGAVAIGRAQAAEQAGRAARAQEICPTCDLHAQLERERARLHRFQRLEALGADGTDELINALLDLRAGAPGHRPPPGDWNNSGPFAP